MKKTYTHITVILDRTGSMDSIRDDTIGGFNTFLKKQKEVPGIATFSLVQFDSQDPYEVIHDFKLIDVVPELTKETYVPRASTPLLDAMGRGINDLEQKINVLDKKKQPEKVVMVIITDGLENASREFKRDQVMKMIQDKKENHNWQFVFLSADLDAIDEAELLGVKASSSLAFMKDRRGLNDVFDSLSEKMCCFRINKSQNLEFEDSDRKHPQDKQKKKK